MLALSSYVTAIYQRRWDAVGLPPPLQYPETYAWLERRIRSEFPSHSPLDDPESLLKKEGFWVEFRPGFACGVCVEDVILASIRKDPKERYLILHHERVHAWSRRLGYEFNDSDAWLATAALVLPPWVRADVPSLLLWSRLPTWFLVLTDAIPEG